MKKYSLLINKIKHTNIVYSCYEKTTSKKENTNSSIDTMEIERYHNLNEKKTSYSKKKLRRSNTIIFM